MEALRLLAVRPLFERGADRAVLQPVQRKKPEAPLAMADGSVSPASAGPAPDARRQFASDDRSVARYKERQANRGRLL